MKVKLREAAEILGVSVDTVRRRVKSGDLPGEKVFEGGVELWMVELPDTVERAQGADEWLHRYVEELERDRDYWREIAMRLATRSQPVHDAIPLGSGPMQPGQRPSLPWWKRLLHLE